MLIYLEEFDGVLYYREPHREVFRICVLESMWKEILTLYHGGKVGGHLAFYKRLLCLKEHYFWPRLRSDIFQQ